MTSWDGEPTLKTGELDTGILVMTPDFIGSSSCEYHTNQPTFSNLIFGLILFQLREVQSQGCFNDSPLQSRPHVHQWRIGDSHQFIIGAPVHDAPHQILVVVLQDAFGDDTEAVGQPKRKVRRSEGGESRGAEQRGQGSVAYLFGGFHRRNTVGFRHGTWWCNMMYPIFDEWIEYWNCVFVWTWGTPLKMANLRGTIQDILGVPYFKTNPFAPVVSLGCDYYSNPSCISQVDVWDVLYMNI